MDLPIPFLKVLLMEGFHPLNVRLEIKENTLGKRNGAVTLAFRITHNDLMAAKINILDTQPQAFHQSEPGTEEELHQEARDAIHFCDHRHSFRLGEDRGKAFRLFGAEDVGRKINFLVKNIPVKKEDGTESLVLGGSRHILFSRQIDDECLNFRDPISAG